MRVILSSLAALPAILLLTAAAVPLPLVFPAVAAAQTAPTSRKTEANQLLQQGVQQYQTSHYQESLQLSQSALDLYRRIGDRQEQADVLRSLSVAYLRLGQRQQATEYYQQALPILHSLGK